MTKQRLQNILLIGSLFCLVLCIIGSILYGFEYKLGDPSLTWACILLLVGFMNFCGCIIMFNLVDQNNSVIIKIKQ